LETAAFGPLPALQPVLAKIEISRAVGEGPDFPVNLGLTVAPDDGPGYRVETSVTVNLMDMDRYRVGRVIVAAYDPAHPWRVQIQPLPPSPAWAERAAHAAVDSAPLSTLITKPVLVPASGPAKRRRGYRPGLYATCVGALASVAVFWTQFTS
jgi:hypothetical protein